VHNVTYDVFEDNACIYKWLALKVTETTTLKRFQVEKQRARDGSEGLQRAGRRCHLIWVALEAVEQEGGMVSSPRPWARTWSTICPTIRLGKFPVHFGPTRAAIRSKRLFVLINTPTV
jgi:hypothetical protein